MQHMQLRGSGGTITVAPELWNDLLEWAEESGWSPEHAREYYRTSGCEVSADDSRRFAEVIEVIAGNLILQENKRCEKFILELIDRFEKLIHFCQSGAFRIE